MKKQFNIAVVGLGQVGIYLLNELNTKKKDIEEKTGKKINIVAISAKNINKKRQFKINKKIFFKNPLEIFKKKKVDILFEAIGLSDGISKKLVETALKNKVNVITPNKTLIAKHGDYLAKLAEQNKVNLEFEASVAGGIPIIRTLRDGLISNDVNWFAGILNGTSNFIFSKMDTEKKSFSNALQLAQELGFAEPDPTLDINGTDAAQKTSILSFISFAADIAPSDVFFEGIENIDSQDMEYGKQLGLTLKPLSVGRSSKFGISMGSFPAFIKKDQILASINNESNVVEINTENLSSTAFSGPGAGGFPTACSVLNDIIDIGQGKFFDYSKLLNKKNILNFDEYISPRYLKIMVKDETGVVAKISSLIAKKNLSIDNLIQKDQDKTDDLIPLVIVLGPSKEKVVIELIKDLKKLEAISGNIQHIRIFSPK